jgi:hypothetical protein
VCHASCLWARCSRSSSCTTVLIVEPGAQDRRRAPLWMMTFWTGTACSSETSHHRSTLPWVYKDKSQRSPLSGAPLSTSGRQIFGVGLEGTQVGEINLMWTQGMRVLDWLRLSHGVIVIHSVLIYYAIEIDSSLFLSGYLQVVPCDF